MRIIYFDLSAIPLFLMILYICLSRKMTRGNANQLFIAVVFISLFSTIADLGMEICDNMVPLSETGRVVCSVSTYIYLALRNANNAVLLLFLLSLTRTTFLIRRWWVKFFYCLPYGVILGLLIQNPFTHNAFTVTADTGYVRGPLMLGFYGIAMIYGVVGLAYCIYCRRYLPTDKWVALMSVYVLAHIAVIIQFFHPELLVEMFSTALGEMLIMLSIMRPEERMDSSVGMLSWASYQSDLRNIVLSGERVQIIVIRMLNYREIRNYLGDYKYTKYLSKIADGIRAIRWDRRRSVELYFERPDSIYIILETDEADIGNTGERLLSEIGEQIGLHEEMGIRFEPRICFIRCPDDLQKAEDIISLGHRFLMIDHRKQSIFHAGEIVHSRTFAIEAHIEEILDRAIRENHIEMYYQPVYDVHSGGFHSAEALARIRDPEYGLISPAIFIPAAEAEGFIIPIGDAVLDQVFRFISEHDLDAMGLKYIEITETTFENISEVMLENINELIRMGYSFALDDYGIGYSSIQRINHIPLKLIKIDRSMLEEASSANGRMILEYTVRMMQSIGKQLVVEGAETGGQVELLEGMNCDYIQGFYFSRPLPGDRFTEYIEDRNSQGGALK